MEDLWKALKTGLLDSTQQRIPYMTARRKAFYPWIASELRRLIRRKRWEDNIREWTGLEFGMSQRAVENREKWRKLVAKSSVVPQRPSRLWD